MPFNRLPNNEASSVADREREAEIDSLLGKRVGIYLLQKRIGKDGMGAIYATSKRARIRLRRARI